MHKYSLEVNKTEANHTGGERRKKKKEEALVLAVMML